MRYYFFGDIHGNSHALERCLRHMDEVKADAAWCLGDLVGWLPFGNRTLERMRSLSFPTVAGNHDLLVAGLLKDFPDQTDRMQATAYNAGLLSAIPGAIDYLSSLPLILNNDAQKDAPFTAVHHSPFHLPPPGEPPTIECFNYLDQASLEASLDRWSTHPTRLIVSGHDHLPGVYELPDSPGPPAIQDVIAHRPPSSGDFTIPLKSDSRYWVKTGSVGGPYRDNIPTANSALYDTSQGTLTLFRLEYPRYELHRELASNLFFQNIATIRRYLEVIGRQSP